MLPLIALAMLLAFLGARIWLATPHAATNRWFAAFTACLAAWVLFIGLLHTDYRLELWGRLSFTSASLIPPTLLVFADVFPHHRRPRWHPYVVLAFLVGLLFAVASITTPWVVYSVTSSPHGLRRHTGPLYTPFAIFFLFVSVATLLVLLHRWRRSRGLLRAQLLYLVTGLLLSAAGAITTNLLLPLVTGLSTYSWLGPYFLLPMVALIGHAILHYRLLDVRVIIHRTVGFTIVILALAWGSIGIVTLLNPQRVTTTVTLPFGGLVTSAVAAIVLSIGIAPRLGRLIDRYVVGGHLAYHQALRDAARELPFASDPRDVAARLRHVLATTVLPDAIILFTHIPDTHVTELLLDERDPRLPSDIAPLEAAAWHIASPSTQVLLLPRLHSANAQTEGHHQVLATAGIEVLVPLGRHRRQVGVLLLSARRDGRAYFAPELDFLEQLAELASLAFELVYFQRQRLAFERKHRQEAELARSAKLYAEVAHEIRTPLTTISNLVSMLPEQYDDPEYRRLLSQLVPAEVSRIVALSERLRTPQPAPLPGFQQLSLSTLLRDVVSLEARASALDAIHIRLDLPETLPPVTADPHSLVQLLRNLLRNAVHATPTGASIDVRARHHRDTITIEILDEGSGLDPTLAHAVATDFVTTKPGGLGLGLSICQQIADAHGATLTIDNRADGRCGVRAALTIRPVPVPVSTSSP